MLLALFDLPLLYQALQILHLFRIIQIIDLGFPLIDRTSRANFTLPTTLSNLAVEI